MTREPHMLYMARERQRELLREAENDRLVRAVSAARPRRDDRVVQFGRPAALIHQA